MDIDSIALGHEIEKQLAQLSAEAPNAAAEGRALAMLTVLFSRCSEEEVASVAACIPKVHHCLHSSSRVVQANAAAALTAAAALDDSLASSIATDCSQQLMSLLQQCSTADDQPDVQLNVVSAAGQLARDQQVAAEALAEPAALSCLLLLADSQRPAKLQEAVADSLCALASQEQFREQLLDAGVVPCVARLLDVSQLEVSVRCLMVLGMLLTSSTAARQQLAQEAAALQQLMELLKQSQDMDCKVIARDLLGVLMKDEELRGQVEAAVRAGAAQQPAAGSEEQQQQQQEAAADEQQQPQ